MPSADFCRPFPAPRDAGSTGQVSRPPRVMRTHLHAYARRIYVQAFRARYRALKIIASSPGLDASYAVSVRQASALPAASFRLHLAMDALAVRLTVPPVGPVENLHLQVGAPCRAQSSRRRTHVLRPLTPPYVRFRIRRFMGYFETLEYDQAVTQVQVDQRGA